MVNGDAGFWTAVGLICTAVVTYPVTELIKRRVPKERRRPATSSEIFSLKTQIDALEAIVLIQNGQIAQLIESQRDVEDLRKSNRRLSKENHMYRSAVAQFITLNPNFATSWDLHRNAIDMEMDKDH